MLAWPASSRARARAVIASAPRRGRAAAHAPSAQARWTRVARAGAASHRSYVSARRPRQLCACSHPPARALRPTPRFSAAQLLGRSRDVRLSIRERRARHRGGLLPSWDVAFHTSHLPWHVPDSGHVDKPRFSTQRELLAHRAEQMLPDPSYASPLQTERRGERESARARVRACGTHTRTHGGKEMRVDICVLLVHGDVFVVSWHSSPRSSALAINWPFALRSFLQV